MKYLSLFLSFLFLGCASAPKSSTDVVAMEKSKVYRQSVGSVTQSSLKPGLCAKHTENVRVKWDWRDAVMAANSCLKANDLIRVDEIGNELSTRNPAAPWGPYFLASVAREKGQLERAIWMSELAIRRATDIGVLHYLKGQILWNKKEYGPAVASFEKSTQLDDSILPAHLFLGQVYYRDQDYDKASKHYYSVLKVEPRNPVALAGIAESQLHDNNSQGALNAYHRLAEAYPSNGQYLLRIAEIYEYVLSDWPQALSTYRVLNENIKRGLVLKGSEYSLTAKIKELEAATSNERTVASSDDKGARRK